MRWMATETIQLEVDAEVARRFRQASDAERQRLRDRGTSLVMAQEQEPRSRREIAEDMSRQAREKGLTPEKLRDILGDELEGCF